MNISRLAILAAVFIGLQIPSSAQKVAVIDVTNILESMDTYRQAQEKLDNMAITWRQEIEREYDEIKAMFTKYQSEQVLLSDELRAQRENEIVLREEKAREMQRQKFGPEGELFKRRQEFIRPIQDEVYEAIESYANSRGYDIILDRNSATGLIFANKSYDKTQEIKDRLNIK